MMGKSFGRRVFEVYDKLPDGVKQHTDKMIRTGAKATKSLRNREQIEKRGRAHAKKLRGRLRI